MKDILISGMAAMGVPLREGAAEQLIAYWKLLEEKNKVMNLTAITGEEDCARLHFLDCAALLRNRSLAGKTLIDVGSGAGFPGLVLKILEPELKLTLLDSLGKRVDFQKEVCEALGLEVSCLHARAEEAKELYGKFDYAAARAVSRMQLLTELCLPFVKKGGEFLAMKGPAPEEEIAEAKNAVRILGGELRSAEKYGIPGTDAVHSIVCVKKLAPTPPKYPRSWAKIKKSPL